VNLVSKGQFHTADRDEDNKINLSELLRVIQFFNKGSYHCDPNGEDGYNPGPGDQTCTPHDSDYEPNNPWKISLTELLRLVQFYNVCGYEEDATREDGFRPVFCPVNHEGQIEGSGEGITEGEGTIDGEGEPYTFARIIIDRRDAVPNTEINIPFYLETDNVSLDYIQFDLIFNSNRVQYMDFMEGPAVQNAGKVLSVGQVIPGKLRLTASGSSTSGMTTGIFAIFRFKVSDKADFNDIYSMYGENILATTYTDGLIFPLSVLAGYIRIYSSFPYPPTAEFSATPLKNLINSEIEFRDESKMGNGTDPSWLWNFGDGNFSVLRNPIHTYQSPGIYTVTLTVITSAGQSVKQKTDYIEIIQGERIYVKKPSVEKQETEGETEPDGLTWETAFPTLQEGIDKAYQLGGGEVWVAGGLYNDIRSNPSGSLILRELVNVYGGFSGTETQLSQRNPQTNVTIIDGSTARNGQPAWHVVIGENYSELNGFVITGGESEINPVYTDAQDGGGLYIPGKKFVIKNCSFYQNKAVDVGAGICCLSGKLSVYNCNFIENSIENNTLSTSNYNYGAAIYAMDSTLNIQGCRFESNQISSKSVWQNPSQNIIAVSAGGAIFVYNSSVVVNNSAFYSNSCTAEGVGDGIIRGSLYGASAKALGGAIYIWYGNLNLSNSDFRNNNVSTNDHSGFSRASAGMLYMTRSSGYVVNSIGFRNKAYDFSTSKERTGGIHLDLCEKIVLSNCTLYENQMDMVNSNHGGAVFNYYSNVSFANTIIWQNSGLGTYSLGNDALFMYCDTQQAKNGEGNISNDPLFIFPSGGNLKLSSSSPCIDRGMNTSADEWGNVLTDIEGNLRGRDAFTNITGDGSDYDIGAYEY